MDAERADDIEEMLRQIGAEILDEPVPERLRRLLSPQSGPDPPEKPGTDANGGRASAHERGQRKRTANGR